MRFLEQYRKKNDLKQMVRLWDRMRAYVETAHAEGKSGSEEDFLALKQEIGQSLVVLQGDFGSAAMNSEAGTAATRIRAFLEQLPTLVKLESVRTRDQDGLQKAWHSIFLTLSELSGAVAHAPRTSAARGPARARYMPVSGEPRMGRRRIHIGGPIGSLFRIVFTLLAIVVLLWIVLFLSQRAGFLGQADPQGAWIPPQNAVLANLGAMWQSTKGWVAVTLPGIYVPIAGFYATYPDISVVVMVGIAFLFAGYVLFIRAK